MPITPALVVFVGIAGKNPEPIQRQLAPILQHSHVSMRAVSPADRATLTRHNDASREIVRSMHVDGVISGALLPSGGSLVLRVIVYDGDGNMKTLEETPLAGKMMSKDELEVLGMNLDGEIGALEHRSTTPTTTALATAAEAPSPPPKAAAPKHAPKAAPKAVKDTLPTPPPEISFDETPPAEAPEHKAAPTETADAVSLDDVASLNSVGDSDGGASIATTAPSSGGLHLHANAGFGLVTRSFSGPATMIGYSATPVGSVRVEGGLSPIDHVSLTVMAERALGMTSPVGTTVASTSMSRVEIEAAYTLTHGNFTFSPMVGVGQRSFEIGSAAAQRSPDTDYGYLILGATASFPLGHRLTLRGLAAFEPVNGGAEPTAMTFGAASRWALDVGAGLEMRPMDHVIVRAALEYQRFAWSWDAAGNRSGGDAVDGYPSGTLSVGAEY